MKIKLWKVVEYDGRRVPTIRNVFASEDEAWALHDGLDRDRKDPSPGYLSVEEINLKVRLEG